MEVRHGTYTILRLLSTQVSLCTKIMLDFLEWQTKQKQSILSSVVDYYLH